MTNTKVRAIRLTDPEVEEAISKGESHGLKPELTAVVRYALKKLRFAPKQ